MHEVKELLKGGFASFRYLSTVPRIAPAIHTSTTRHRQLLASSRSSAALSEQVDRRMRTSFAFIRTDAWRITVT